MKCYFTTLIALLLTTCIYSTEVVLTGGNQNDVLTAITTLNTEGGGVIVINGDVFINNDITIPETVTIKVINGHKLKIKGNVTLTINGLIEAGPYQIFEQDDNGTVEDCFWDRWDFTLDDGKVRGNLKNAYVVPQWWGVDDTGVTICGQSFQNAIESFPNVQKFVANGKFLLEKTLHLNQNNRYYDFTGATFIGVNESRNVCRAFENSYPQWYTTPSQIEDMNRLPETWPATDTGGLINIGKRRDLTETSPYSVVNVTIDGGIYVPKSIYDNALGILNAKNSQILNVTIHCYDGLRGIAIQHPANWNVATRTDHVIIRNVIQQGGINVINIDLSRSKNQYVKNVIIDNIIGHDVTGTEVDGTTYGYAFRLSNQNDLAIGEIVKRIENVSISNVVLTHVNGGFYFDGVTGNLSNTQVIGYGKKDATKLHKEEKNSDLMIANYRIKN